MRNWKRNSLGQKVAWKKTRERGKRRCDDFLNPTGIPNRAGIENLVRSLQAQGRFIDRKISFTEVADDRLATEVAKELGYK